MSNIPCLLTKPISMYPNPNSRIRSNHPFPLNASPTNQTNE